MPSRECFIYGLRDPRTMEIRYVGQTSRGMDRPRSHTKPGNLARGFYVSNWLKSIGSEPEIVILERIDNTGLNAKEIKALLNEAEIHWISIGREALGHRLTNGTAGGEGFCNPSSEVIEKMSIAQRRRWATPEGRAHIEAIQALSRTQEARAKLSNTKREQAKTPEGRVHLEALFVASHKQETRAKITATRRANAATPEGYAHLVAQLSKNLHTPEAYAKMVATVSSPESRDHKSAQMKEWWTQQTPEARNHRSDQLKERWAQSPERRAKLGETNKQRVWTDESKQKLSERSFSEETRQKMSLSKKGKKKSPLWYASRWSPEHRSELKEANKQRVWTEEAKQKLATAARQQAREQKMRSLPRIRINLFESNA